MVDKYQADKPITPLRRLHTDQFSKWMRAKNKFVRFVLKQKRTKIT